MFHSVSLVSQAPLARGSRALPSVMFYSVVSVSVDWLVLKCLAEASVDVPPSLRIVSSFSFVSFLSLSILSLLPFLILSFLPFLIFPSLSTIPSFTSDQFFVLLR